MLEKRETGVLLHLTSLPSNHAIGDMGEEARAFIDKIAENGIKAWQVLPIGPTLYGDSPYASSSAFAGNELFISLRELYLEDFLTLDDVLKRAEKSARVDYKEAKEFKMPLLFKAAKTFLEKGKDKEYEEFKRKEAFWLNDYALFQALSLKYGDTRWYLKWPKGLLERDEKALKKAEEENRERVEIYKALQFFFRKQWKALKEYAGEREVKIIGDIPMFVSLESSDAWANRDILKISKEGKTEKQAGVPPDAFSETGQLWGNPVYSWKENEKGCLLWWKERFKESVELFDLVRIDHFRGFSAVWEVPGRDKTAAKGKWATVPGGKLFSLLKKEIGDNLPFIAEDLGVITPDVERIRDENKIPGTKVFHFAFGFEDLSWQTDNLYLPHNVEKNSVYYTGTHDNNTTKGWYSSLDEGMKDYVRRYLESSDEDIVRASIRALMMSGSSLVVIPLQDILNLGEEARMNTPSTCGTFNWSWKMKEDDFNSPLWQTVKYFSTLYGRDK